MKISSVLTAAIAAGLATAAFAAMSSPSTSQEPSASAVPEPVPLQDPAAEKAPATLAVLALQEKKGRDAAKKAEAPAGGRFAPAESTPPPSMIFIKGGKATIGSSKDDIEKLLEDPANHGPARMLDGETPQHTVDIDDIFAGTYEVTNEQYFQFVKATDRKPPEHWAAEAIANAQRAFLETEGKKAKDARDANEPAYTPRVWDEDVKEAWLDDNWRDIDWGIPKDQETTPVCFVDFEDATEYCRWAGMRLPTEHEWSYFARAKSDSIFPWGDEWSAVDRAHTSELGARDLAKVGTYPAGASPLGLMDMSGNAWEWTSSPYIAYPKFKVGKYKVKVAGKKIEIQRESDFRPEFKVIKGGGYGTPMLAARVAMRQGTLKSQTAAELGFRVVASNLPGQDRMQSAWKEDLRGCPARRDDALLDFRNVCGIDRWELAQVEGDRPAGYAVAAKYDAIAFAPRAELKLKPGPALKKASMEWPVTIGALSTTVPMVTPPLEPGNYLVLYRGKGKLGEVEEPAEGEAIEAGAPGKGDAGDGAATEPAEGGAQEESADDAAPPTPDASIRAGIDPKKNQLLFVDAKTGMFCGSMNIDLKQGARPRDTVSTVEYEERQDTEGTGSDKKFVKQDWLIFKARLEVPGKRFSQMEFEFQTATGALGAGWRRLPQGK